MSWSQRLLEHGYHDVFVVEINSSRLWSLFASRSWSTTKELQLICRHTCTQTRSWYCAKFPRKASSTRLLCQHTARLSNMKLNVNHRVKKQATKILPTDYDIGDTSVYCKAKAKLHKLLTHPYTPLHSPKILVGPRSRYVLRSTI
ncbi:hypothetical protein JG688_00014017 [Phytophthora aleatoria]|uniref:Uncharacterized protein n=1 Tax=Phytophthora aleatoria TaxID=2496075 RepID=A0A8J5ILI7_9STRA|nr:hypothetical protein JG688_00014017 [Phytophthora aleatoria]